jgi:putative transcriptional regulator
MTAKRKETGRLATALLETARDMRRADLLDDAAYAKITMRHMIKGPTATARSLTPGQIRSLRERARMSQAVFARHPNVTSGYVSQLERGTRHATGAALALLNVIRRKGIEAIL